MLCSLGHGRPAQTPRGRRDKLTRSEQSLCIALQASGEEQDTISFITDTRLCIRFSGVQRFNTCDYIVSDHNIMTCTLDGLS